MLKKTWMDLVMLLVKIPALTVKTIVSLSMTNTDDYILCTIKIVATMRLCMHHAVAYCYLETTFVALGGEGA